MATLTPLQAASPLEASDNNRLLFTVDLTETLNRALDDTDADFTTMDTLSWQVEYRVATVSDDTYALAIRIVNGATILAAADSGGTFQTVSAGVTSTTDTLSPVTAFTYVNTTANKTTWDGAVVELRQTYTQVMAKDNGRIEVDFTEFTGTYTPAVAGSALLKIQNESSSLIDDELVARILARIQADSLSAAESVLAVRGLIRQTDEGANMSEAHIKIVAAFVFDIIKVVTE